MRTISLTAVVSLTLSTMPVALPPGAATRWPAGSSERRLSLADARLTVFTYRPACRDPSLLLVFHGQGHNADDYRDWARPLADKHCMLVVAPRFSKSQFPRWRYQHGGIARDGEVQDPRAWSGRLIPELAERIQQLEGRKMPYSLIGHSAGGQFLSRLAAFTPTQAQRIVIANPGTHVCDPKIEAPYGFGGVYASNDVDKELRRYLGTPITIFPRPRRHGRGGSEHEPRGQCAGTNPSRAWAQCLQGCPISAQARAGPSIGASSRSRRRATRPRRCSRAPRPRLLKP
jgi:pimeloyl-ACP methyl ester carboxylesterase